MTAGPTIQGFFDPDTWTERVGGRVAIGENGVAYLRIPLNALPGRKIAP